METIYVVGVFVVAAVALVGSVVGARSKDGEDAAELLCAGVWLGLIAALFWPFCLVGALLAALGLPSERAKVTAEVRSWIQRPS